MRAQHTLHSLPVFPIYSASFVADDQIVLGGGGGSSRSGVLNRLRLYKIPEHSKLNLLHEYELQSDEDVPMSMAADPTISKFVCGINSSTESMKEGRNQNCRVFSINDERIKPLATTSTLKSGAENMEDYQRVTVLSPNRKLVAVAGNRDFMILDLETLTPLAKSYHTEHDIYDLSFSSNQLVVATTEELLVFDIPQEGKPQGRETRSKKVKKAAPEIIVKKTVQKPVLPGSPPSTYRAARFLPGDDHTLFVVLNTAPPRTRGKSTTKSGFLCRVNTQSWEIGKPRKLGERGITCFDISPNGHYLAYASADYTIGLLDAKTLAPLLTILKSHEFPSTTLRFNPSSTLLISGSADNSIRVIKVPDGTENFSWATTTILFILVLLLAVLYQVFVNQS